MSVDQTRFHDALLDAARDIPAGLSDGQGHPAGRRFSVYRNNVAVSLTEALELSFPAIRKLIGEDNFRKVAGLFLRQHPPSTPMIMYYGDEFPDFLQSFTPLSSIGYLPDVARLEQALRESYHAADAPPADAGVLQKLAPEDLAQVRMTLAPSIRLVRSPWPIHAIWAYNMEDGAPKPQEGAQNVLITRPKFDPLAAPVADGTATFIQALQSDRPLADAAEAAATDSNFDLAQALALLLDGCAITDISPGGSSK